MHQPAFLTEAVILFSLAIIVAMLFRTMRIPSILGFLLTGSAIGPSGWGFISQNSVGDFAEVGLVLLLFTVGLELSPKPLLHVGKRLSAIIAVQFVLTVLLAIAVMWTPGWADLATSVLIGLAITLSSTAIVLKILSDRGDTGSSTGIVTVGVLLLQDVVVILVMLFLPLFASNGDEGMGKLVLRELAIFIGFFAVVAVCRIVLPRALDVIARYGGRELITLFAVLMAVGGAWLAGQVNWSLGLGACIAGLLLADADQRHQLVADITPFRDVFNAIFFVALGMLVDLTLLLDHFWLLVMAVVLTLFLKTLITAFATLAAGFPLRIAIIVGVSLCTVSEFAYVLLHQAHDVGLLSEAWLGLITIYTVGTMLLGTLLFPLGPRLAYAAERFRGKTVALETAHVNKTGDFDLENHVVIVGFGITGHNLAKLLTATNISYCVIEMNPQLAREARELGAPVLMGDATRTVILHHAAMEKARVIVIAINDPGATEAIVAHARMHYPNVFILVRVRYVSLVDTLHTQGANLVIPADFETSIEIAAHVLKQFRIPSNIINSQLASIRAGGYGILRGLPADRAFTEDLLKILEMTTTETYYLEAGSPAAGQTLAQLDLRARSGCNIIGIVRAGHPVANLPADFILQSSDVLVLVGAHEQLDRAREILRAQ